MVILVRDSKHIKKLFTTAVPDPKDDTKCEPERPNVVPYGNGTCLELVEDPKKDEDDASEYVCYLSNNSFK